MFPKDLQIVLERMGEYEAEAKRTEAAVKLIRFAHEFYASFDHLEKKKQQLEKECDAVEEKIRLHRERIEAAIATMNKERQDIESSLQRRREAEQLECANHILNKKQRAEELQVIDASIRAANLEREKLTKQIQQMKQALSQQAARLEALAQ